MRHHSCVAAALALAVLAPSAHAQQKQPIERADQLPIHTYAVAGPPSALLLDEAGLARLAGALRADLEADLAAYDIRDAAALRSYYRALQTIALLQHRDDDVLAWEKKARPLEEKPAQRILSGMRLRPLVAADRAPAGAASQAFATALAEELRRLPYDSVQAELKAQKGRLEILAPGSLQGMAQNMIDPAARAGRISKDFALQLLDMGFALQRVLPYRDEAVRQLSALIAAHHVDKPDIWAARDVSLDGRAGLKPVVVAISDVGVDPALFAGRMWTNAREVPGNGKDDDGNGYVDDVHGIGWTWEGAAVAGDLRPVPIPAADLDRAKHNMKGFTDVQAGLDSPEAQAVKRMFASMTPAQVKPLYEAMSFYTNYGHGTHVAGITAQGNPAVRLLVLRLEFPYEMLPPAPSAALAAGFARAMERSIDYYRNAGVRVVNMSWGLASTDFEQMLEQNSVGASQEERRRLALQYFDTIKAAFGAAIARAPEILFVFAAGNDNASNQFYDFIPASFDYPNTITVGAVDKAGDEAAFTSFGKADVYANGYEVESVLPGGDKQRWSGTSMASPQVANLAAKLLAVHPELSAAQVKQLILDGADPRTVSAGRSIRLLNEVKSFQLAGPRAAKAAPITTEGGRLPVPGGTIWYRAVGSGSATPLVLLHGGPGISSVYLKSMEALADERIVVRYDQLGAGKSDVVTDTTLFNIGHFVEELDSLRRALGLERIHLYGHSWGSILALEYYRAHPQHVASLVLASEVLDIPGFYANVLRLFQMLPDSEARAMLAQAAGQPFDTAAFRAANRDYNRRYTAHKPVLPEADTLGRTANDAIADHMNGTRLIKPNGTLSDYDARPFLKRIRVPVLFLVGEDDFVAPEIVRAHARLTPGARVVVIPASGHMLQWDNAPVHNEAVRQFLREVDRRSE